MIVYNVTTKVDWSIADEWLEWMKKTHIPDVLATGCFSSYNLYKLLQVDDVDGLTYTIQYFATTMNDYEEYIQRYAGGFRKEILGKYGDKLIAFRSIMQEVEA